MTGWPVAERIAADDVDPLFAGARLFTSGSGGGSGLASVPVEWLRAVLLETGPVRLVRPGRARGWCAAVGFVGAPFLLDEQLPTGDEVLRAVRRLERWTGRELDAVVALNAAGENALLPVIAAAQLGVPLLDADGMGRVFPLVEQTTFALSGISPTPLAVAGSGGEVVVLDCPANRLEVLLRQTVLSCGGWVVCAGYPADARRLGSAGIDGGISRALGVGRWLREGVDGDTVARRLGGRSLGRGKVIDVERRTARWGSRTLPAAASSVVVREESGHVLRLEVHNEVLLALDDGGAVASVPDAIGLLDVPGHQVLGVEDVAIGREVDVVVLPAAQAWRGPRGLALAGPGAFGLGGPGWP
ncbi:DUF917 domain-containing protein [Saccharopolyspora rosea]|uniref:DUF917 domain-containing protein n=1 Tax=Saccharopolyspora rosea TaxID=524884 RepID=A0ABW3FVL6_9PSEU|nr:DUF917 domain-containing protein [Saccharopolyspora rosea]